MIIAQKAATMGIITKIVPNIGRSPNIRGELSQPW
jgi:hypothetical protein